MCLAWAQARLGDADGLAQFLSHGETLYRSGRTFLAPLFHGRLAELQAEQCRGRRADFDRSAHRIGSRGRHPIRRRPAASHPRRHPAHSRSCESRPRRGGLPRCHRHRARARRAQFPTARGAVARQALPIDRPPRRSPRRPRAGARRLLADARNAGDRRGAGAARGAGGNRGGQGRDRAAPATASICKRPTVRLSSGERALQPKKPGRHSPASANLRGQMKTLPRSSLPFPGSA